jgi:hypothetical protein
MTSTTAIATMPLTFDAFLASKAQSADGDGFAPIWLPDFLFDFQAHLDEWAIRKGRAAIFADCGMGKSALALVWAENVVRYTNRRVLILTPLAVAQQFVREGMKFGIDVHHSRDGGIKPGINVTNYERLHKFDANDFAGVVCDESGILKSFDGKIRDAVVEFMRTMRYRLLCTATAAPNDFTELGNSSEALGCLGYMDMLGRFFKNDRNNSASRDHGRSLAWRFRGHAEQPFWRWVCSWARAVRRPSDLCDAAGRPFDDARFTLPPLTEREHVIRVSKPRQGMLFAMPAVGLKEEREERRDTIEARCEKAAQLIAAVTAEGRPSIAWCHLNPEGKLLANLIPGAVEVSGTDKDEAKEEKFNAFSTGQAKVLVTKPKIGAWGLNWQHCSHMTMFSSHSFEQEYQAIRRCWRFGQEREVVVDRVLADGESRVAENLQRKAEQADKMFAELTRHIRDELAIERGRTFGVDEEMPEWL